VAPTSSQTDALVSRDGSKRAAAQARKSTLFILQQLVTKDFKLKYRRSVLGVLWSVLNPLLMMAVLTVVFSNMFRFDIAYYPFYLILGMTLFTLMNDATTTAMTSIIDSAGLLKKVRVAKAVFPVEKVLFSLVNYVFAFVAVLVVMLVLRVPLSPTMFAWPLLVLYVVVFCVGLGLILSSLAVFFRDVIHLWSVVTMAWNYLTPIFWPEEYLTSLQGGLGTLLLTIEQFNPMYYYVSYLRQIMMYQTLPDLGFNLICVAFALVTLAVGVLVFRKTQSKFILYI
jgi:ABC-2 type transport system permease protein